MSDSALHLMLLDGNWCVWRWLRLRGAGFDANMVSQLRAPESVKAVARLIEAQAALEQAFSRAQADIEALVGASEGEHRRELVSILRKVRKRKLAAEAGPDVGLQPLRESQLAVERAADALARSYDQDTRAISAELRAVVNQEAFQEAIIWQNLEAYRTAVQRVMRGAGDSKKQRRAEQMVAIYLQRYCLKNDTIGFFGPQGSATFSPEPGWNLQYGPGLVKNRRVYFEHWAMSALADSFATRPELRIQAVPRLLGNLRLEGTQLCHSLGDKNELPEEFAAVIAACDGARTAKELAALVVGDLDNELDEEEEVVEILELLASKGIIAWSFDIPTALNEPEFFLSEALSQIPGPVGKQARSELQELCVARDRVAGAAGKPALLAKELDDLNSVFESLTGTESNRSSGEMYAGRTLVYEECRRDVDLAIGPATLSAISEPLALLLASARWFTDTVGKGYQKRFLADFREIVATSGQDKVEYLILFDRIRRHLGSDTQKSELVGAAQRELQQRWKKVLQIDDERRILQVASADIADAVRDAFAADGPGWPSARYHSPDFMVIDPASEHPRFVLGEVHAAVNTCGIRVYQSQHDDPNELVEARTRDLPDGTVVPVVSRGQASRADHVWMNPNSVDLETGSTPSWRPRHQVLRVADLQVEERAGQLWVIDRESKARYTLTELLDSALSAEVAADFNYLPAMPHRPRVVIDNMVIGRESWIFEPGALACFADCARGVGQFEAARRWALELALPERIFVKIPEETKPIFIDLMSPIYIEILARLVRKASILAVSEMLPEPDSLWLSDRAGRSYTAELRIVAVDPVPWRCDL